MCDFCFDEDEDLSGCLWYGHKYEDCVCADPECDMRVCLYCGDSY